MNPADHLSDTAPSFPSSAASKNVLPWLVAVAFFMESLNTTILNTAVPVISAALKVAPLSMKSVLASYTLSLAVFIPISGWMVSVRPWPPCKVWGGSHAALVRSPYEHA
jgi:MFS family permease